MFDTYLASLDLRELPFYTADQDHSPALDSLNVMLSRLGVAIETLPLYEQVDHVIQHSGLIEHHQKDKADRGEARVENLEELVSAARGFDADQPVVEGTGEMTPIAAFLSHAVLEPGEGAAGPWEDSVQMKSLH